MPTRARLDDFIAAVVSGDHAGATAFSANGSSTIRRSRPDDIC
jgi:hypothetical protein